MNAINSGEKRKLDSLQQDEDSRQSLTACDSCRTKKQKCSKDRPRCQPCLQHDRECHYGAQVVRSPLTRVYLTEVEDRLRKLEAIFKYLLPDVDIEDALSPSSLPQLPTQISSPKSPRAAAAKERKDPSHGRRLSEALPQEADGFDWQEEAIDLNGLSDGMAALSVEPSGIGYLGPTSGVVFLRSLLPWITGATLSARLHNETCPSPQTANNLLEIFQSHDQAQSPHLTTQLIDNYFANYHTSYPFIHEATFRAQYSGLVKRPEVHAWHMLFNSILALGAWTSGNESNNLDEVYYRKAVWSWQGLSILESGSLPLVQALLLLSNYTQKRNKPNTGWNFLGLAVRMALSLGFHRELPKWDINLLQREMRRRVWWGLFIFDSGASMTFGRAILLPGSDMMDVKQILNVPDELLTPLTDSNPPEVDEPTLYSSLIAQAQFHLAANRILKRLLSSANLSAGEALALNDVMTPWTAGLPWYFRLDHPLTSSWDWYVFARARLWWKYWNLQIIMTRPFLLGWASRNIESRHNFNNNREEKECRSLCINSAHRTITSAEEYIRQTPLTRVASWYTLYFVFHAALVTAVCLYADPTSPEASEWTKDVDTVKTLLHVSFWKNKLAKRCLEILDGLRPNPDSDDGHLQSMLLQTNDGIGDCGFWSTNAADSPNGLSWLDFGQDFP